MNIRSDGKEERTDVDQQFVAPDSCGHPVSQLEFLAEHKDSQLSGLSGFHGALGLSFDPGLMFQCNKCGQEFKVTPVQLLPTIIDSYTSVRDIAKTVGEMEERVADLETVVVHLTEWLRTFVERNKNTVNSPVLPEEKD